MGLRDILRKKDKIEESKDNRREDAVNSLKAPEFTFIRSDTNTHEIIHPPSDGNSPTYEGRTDGAYLGAYDAKLSSPATSPRSRGFPPVSSSNNKSSGSNSNLTTGPSPARRLSQRLRLSRAPASSENVPADLPEIVTTTADPAAADDRDGTELQWEKRATILAKTANENEALHRSAPASPALGGGGPPVIPAELVQQRGGMRVVVDDGRGRTDAKNGVASTPTIDADIQQAIKLHEEGELEQSTRLFGVLADPKGANNPLSQVLYGLALR